MIPHAGFGPPQSIPALAHPVRPSAWFSPLAPALGRAQPLLPGFRSARLVAVALPALAMAANAEHRSTGTKAALSENSLGHGYPSFQTTLHYMTDDARPRRRQRFYCVPPADVQETTYSGDRLPGRPLIHVLCRSPGVRFPLGRWR